MGISVEFWKRRVYRRTSCYMCRNFRTALVQPQESDNPTDTTWFIYSTWLSTVHVWRSSVIVHHSPPRFIGKCPIEGRKFPIGRSKDLRNELPRRIEPALRRYHTGEVLFPRHAYAVATITQGYRTCLQTMHNTGEVLFTARCMQPRVFSPLPNRMNYIFSHPRSLLQRRHQRSNIFLPQPVWSVPGRARFRPLSLPGDHRSSLFQHCQSL